MVIIITLSIAPLKIEFTKCFDKKAETGSGPKQNKKGNICITIRSE